MILISQNEQKFEKKYLPKAAFIYLSDTLGACLLNIFN